MYEDGSTAQIYYAKEAALRDSLAAHLQSMGFVVRKEMQMVAGRCDIASGSFDSLEMIIEVKIADPIRAIGQLFGYSAGYDPAPTLILAVPEKLRVDAVTLLACQESNIELWRIRAGGEPFRFIGSRKPKYREELISRR